MTDPGDPTGPDLSRLDRATPLGPTVIRCPLCNAKLGEAVGSIVGGEFTLGVVMTAPPPRGLRTAGAGPVGPVGPVSRRPGSGLWSPVDYYPLECRRDTVQRVPHDLLAEAVRRGAREFVPPKPPGWTPPARRHRGGSGRRRGA